MGATVTPPLPAGFTIDAPLPPLPAGFVADGTRGPIKPRQPDALDNPNMATEGQSFGQNALAGAGKAFADIGRGVGQFIGAVPQSDVDEAEKRDKPLMQTGGGVTGNIAGNVAALLPTMLIPGANSIGGGAAIGSAMGALQPVQTGDSRLGNVGVGAIGGAAGNALAKGVSRVVSPQTREQVRLLMREGVTPTPGQIIGGRAQLLEDKLTSLPIVGDAISSARGKSLNEFQRAAYARALAPIGAAPSGALGREGVGEVRAALQSAYNDLTPRLSFRADPQFNAELASLRQMATQLPEQQSRQFNQILATQVEGKMTGAGLMNGARLKEVESELGRIASGYHGDSSFDNRQLGDAVRQVQNLLRENLARMNPQHADELNAINSGWANYSRLRDAASRTGAVNGEFTPAQLAAAIRSGDKTVGKRAYSEGTALMQDLSDAGRGVLSSRYPDSGTAGRALLGVLTAAGGAAISPTTLIPPVVASLPYMAGGRQVTAAMLARRPEFARQLAEAIRGTAPQIGMAGSALGLEQ